VKSLMWLVSCMLNDISIRCRTDTSRDFRYISRRVEHEGSSFLTISLSNFGKDFERSLDQGYIGPDMFIGFHQPNRRVAFPAFLQGLLGRVFESSGKLLDVPDVEAIRCVRQICLMWKKIHLPCSKERIDEAFTSYVKCDTEVPTGPDDYPNRLLCRFRNVSELLWSSVLFRVNEIIADGECVRPRHGPGATAERISGNGKYVFREWTTRLEAAFPFTGYGLASLNQLEELNLEEIDFREPEEERPVRVIAVPKTLKTPRIIAIEPVCMQYTQQAVLEHLVDYLESVPLVKGHINFSDQSINQRLALIGSADGSYATLDLSEASDRVSLVLVEEMLASSSLSILRDAVLACRSTRADVPGHGIIVLNKFASMGSALCFPIESMVFLTIGLCAIMEELNLPDTYAAIAQAMGHIWVYGDDIIVSANKVHAVLDWLTSFKMKVNTSKSFWTGRFRESCGMDAYAGEPVTPVYLRRLPPQDRRSGSEIVSFVAFANQLYENGYWQTARAVRTEIEAILGPLPHVLDTSPALGWVSYCKSRYSIQRFNARLHRPEVKGYVTHVKKESDNLDDYPALLKSFLRRGEEPTVDPEHLTKSVLSARVDIKSRWSTPY